MRILLLTILLALGACNTTGSAPVVAPDAKALILANKGKLWKDADSIKNASIAAPTRHMGFMWHVCVRLNAKNSFGGYVGERETLIGIYDSGKLDVLMADAAFSCEEQPHMPFPELEGGYRAAGPQGKPRQN